MNKFVLDFECVLATWPTLRTITIRPEILPAPAQKEGRWVLGRLAGKDEIRIQSRSLPGCTTATAKLERAHPARLAFWIARGADHIEGRPPIEATRELVLRQLSAEHDRHWPYVPPVLRPAASVIALAALNWLARLLYDYRDGVHMPRLEPDEIGLAFEDAFSEMQQWSGESVNVDADGNGAVTAARQALLESGLVLRDDEQRPVWLAPLVEDAVRPDESLESVKKLWLTLDDEDRQVAFHRPNNPL